MAIEIISVMIGTIGDLGFIIHWLVLLCDVPDCPLHVLSETAARWQQVYCLHLQ